VSGILGSHVLVLRSGNACLLQLMRICADEHYFGKEINPWRKFNLSTSRVPKGIKAQI
jgi:hypothetical protein